MQTTVKIIFFFFQAEDGIRDFHVTGVQTCALPISKRKVKRPFFPQSATRFRLPRSLAAYRVAKAIQRRLRANTTRAARGYRPFRCTNLTVSIPQHGSDVLRWTRSIHEQEWFSP